MVLQLLSISNDTIYLSNDGFVKLPPETDPIFSAWDKSTGVAISESQITDLKHFTGDSITGNETAFDGWDKDASDDFTTSDETDPVYSADSAFVKSGVRSWNSSLAKQILTTDTTRWGQDADLTNELNTGVVLNGNNLEVSDAGGTITTDLSSLINDADADPTNELQSISRTGLLVTLNQGGGTFQDSVLTETDVDAMVNNNGYQLSASDGNVDNTNELQKVDVFNISGNNIQLSLENDGEATKTIDVSTTTAISANTAKVSNAAHTGDVTGSTALIIGDNKVLEKHLKAVDTPNDEEYLTYEATTGDFEWQSIPAAHEAVTVGTANGLSLSAQQISLSAATTSTAGAMSSSDKTKLDKIASTATTASGIRSTAIGYKSTASGEASTAIGNGARASGDNSIAMGDHTIASLNNSTVVGRYNAENADALFIVGSGYSSSRMNAFEVENDGDVWIGDDLSIGTDDGTDDDIIYFDSGTAEYLRWDESQTEFDFSDDVDISGELEANELWSTLGTSTMYKLTTTYGFSQEVYWTTSDKRMKKNIKSISNPLEKLQLLRGVTYDWNKKAKDYFIKDIKENVRPDELLSESEKEAIWEEEKQKLLDEAERRKMSFIAQEVEAVFPEWVKENDDGIKEIDMKGLNSLLVEAVKELKAEKDKEIAALKAENTELEARLSKLEALVGMMIEK